MEAFCRHNPSFVDLALRFEHLIEAGVYEEGQRLPSVREIALAERLNPSTVARAYQKVVNDGYCLAIEKKGYFVCKAKAKDPLVELLSSLLKQGYRKEDIAAALSLASKENEDD